MASIPYEATCFEVSSKKIQFVRGTRSISISGCSAFIPNQLAHDGIH